MHGRLRWLWVLLLVGCASTGPVREWQTDEAAYFETRRIDTGLRLGTGGYGSGTPVYLVAQVRCPGGDCEMATVELRLVTGSDAVPVYLERRDLVLNADGASWRWESAQDPRYAPESTPVRGLLVQVQTNPQVLRQLAEAQQVTGSVGGLSFRLGYTERAALRALVARLEAALQGS
ncbi:hypothetical protein [Rhodothermus marinus]|uniref:hypothetical protein n=1 Tax=Rhodothermus marinus TaxID=29549 RepID=UPI0012BA4557|nr:hypothetical protein [Rhodothermus marinus]BBM73652.1 hypothetical protein RmaAA338_25170 [Rhodothermus marinus]